MNHVAATHTSAWAHLQLGVGAAVDVVDRLAQLGPPRCRGRMIWYWQQDKIMLHKQINHICFIGAIEYHCLIFLHQYRFMLMCSVWYSISWFVLHAYMNVGYYISCRFVYAYCWHLNVRFLYVSMVFDSVQISSGIAIMRRTPWCSMGNAKLSPRTDIVPVPHEWAWHIMWHSGYNLHKHSTWYACGNAYTGCPSTNGRTGSSGCACRPSRGIEHSPRYLLRTSWMYTNKNNIMVEHNNMETKRTCSVPRFIHLLKLSTHSVPAGAAVY